MSDNNNVQKISDLNCGTKYVIRNTKNIDGYQDAETSFKINRDGSIMNATTDSDGNIILKHYDTKTKFITSRVEWGTEYSPNLEKPEELKVILTKNYVDYDSVVLKEENNWGWCFSGLLYNAGNGENNDYSLNIDESTLLWKYIKRVDSYPMVTTNTEVNDLLNISRA